MRSLSSTLLICIAAACTPTIYPGTSIDGGDGGGGIDLMPVVRTCTPARSKKIDCPAPEYKALTGHIGCDYIHDVCADGAPVGGNDYWDMKSEPIGCGDEVIVYGRHFDAIKLPIMSGKIRVWEVKTIAYSNPKYADPKYDSLKMLKVKQAVEEIGIDLAIAKMCGMQYTFATADSQFAKDIQLALGGLVADPDLLVYHAAGCDPSTPLDAEPDPDPSR